MSRLLYRERDRIITFRRHESSVPYLCERMVPETLRGGRMRDCAMLLEDQVEQLVLKSGWVGPEPINADSELGRVLICKREW